jgi:hypothetical protein
MTLPNIEDEDIEDILYSLIYPFIAIKKILNFFLCELVKKK